VDVVAVVVWERSVGEKVAIKAMISAGSSNRIRMNVSWGFMSD
jgi:hypothetical protein